MKEKLPEDVFAINTIPPLAIDGSQLEKMWGMRAELSSELIRVGKMPEVKASRIHQWQYQQTVREYMSFMVEELSEAMEQYTSLHQFVIDSENRDFKKALVTLKNYNEEIADVIHIMLLIMDYSGISSFDLEEYFEVYCEQIGIGATWLTKAPLQSFIGIGGYVNGIHGRKYMNASYKIQVKDDSAFYKGGLHVSNALTVVHKELVYDIIHYLMLAKNQLKNKPWKSKHVAVNTAQYQQHLIEVWLRLFTYLDFIGHDARSIYEIFYRKNQVNLNRIKNNY